MRVATKSLTLLHNDLLLQHDANLLMRRHIDCHPPVRRPARGIGRRKRPFRQLYDLFYLYFVRNLHFRLVSWLLLLLLLLSDS